MQRRLRGAGVILAAATLALLTLFATAVVPVSAATTATAELTGIRVGRHATFDRVVLDLAGPPPTVTGRFVAALTADPSDRPVLLPCPSGNERFLLVTARPAAARR